jgi:hypothetical protein
VIDHSALLTASGRVLRHPGDMTAGMNVLDDEGRHVALPARVSRVVSLVPSLTEAVGVTAPGLLVGATDWCTHPGDLDVTRVRGTKNPDIEAIVDLRPDLVLANAEENKPDELEKLRAAGLAVYVTDIRTVDGALRSLERMLAACGLDRPAWIDGARAAWDALALPDAPRRAVVPIWRKPWMAVGSAWRTCSTTARSATRASTPPTCRPTTSSCCPTSPTASPPRTGRRASGRRRRWSAGVCSPGTGRACSRPPTSCPRRWT